MAIRHTEGELDVTSRDVKTTTDERLADALMGYFDDRRPTLGFGIT